MKNRNQNEFDGDEGFWGDLLFAISFPFLAWLMAIGMAIAGK